MKIVCSERIKRVNELSVFGVWFGGVDRWAESQALESGCYRLFVPAHAIHLWCCAVFVIDVAVPYRGIWGCGTELLSRWWNAI